MNGAALLLLSMIALDSTRQWHRARRGRRRLRVAAALVCAVILTAPAERAGERKTGMQPPIIVSGPADAGADAAAPVFPAPPALERGSLLAREPIFAGEPLAEGCSPAAGWEATQCHTAVGKP